MTQTSGPAVAPNVQGSVSGRMAMKLRGLYAVTPESSDTDLLCQQVGAALDGGAAAVQYRFKHLAPSLAQEQAGRLLEICRRHGQPLIINDSVELMLAVKADGVHLGREDEDPFRVRRAIGRDYLVGVSCYDDFDRALRFRPIADYLAFGSVFASATKPQAIVAPLSLFERARALGMPTVAIGGIDADNVARVALAGAEAVAVISGLFGTLQEPEERVRTRARTLVAAFDLASDRKL